MCADVTAEAEDGGEVGLDDYVPVGVWKLGSGMPALDAGAVEEDGWVVRFEDFRG